MDNSEEEEEFYATPTPTPTPTVSKHGACQEGTVGARTKFDISTHPDIISLSNGILKLYTKTAADYDWDNY